MTTKTTGHVALATALMAIPLLTTACSRNAVTPSTSASESASVPVAGAGPVSPPAAATTPAPSAPDAAQADLVVLAAGQSVQLASSAVLGFDRVVNDSRCPADVQCVWAGEVTLALSLKSKGEAQAFQLSGTTSPRATLSGHVFELRSFGACPAGHPAPAPSAECAILKVTPR